MSASGYSSADYSPANDYYNYNYSNYYAAQCDSNYDNSQWSYPSTPSSNSSNSNYTSPHMNNYSTSYLTSPIPKYNDYASNYIPYQDNSSPIESQVNTEQVQSISPIIQVKKSKRPRVVKLDLEQTSIGFGVPQKSTKLKDSDVEGQLKCTMCTKTFKSSAKLFMHQHKYHNNGSSLQCPICLKSFNSQANALVHVRAHTQEKSYKCHICSVGFCDSSTLKKHVRTHTGEKPYECHLCPKRFTQSGNLKRHLTVHDKYDVIQAKHLNQVSSASQSSYSLNDDIENDIKTIRSEQPISSNWYPEQYQQASNDMIVYNFDTTYANYYNNQCYYSNNY